MEVKKFAVGNLTVTLHQDQDPPDPRKEYEHLGKMVCFHKQYNLGDPTDYCSDDFECWDEVSAQIEADHPGATILPVYMYDHSGLTISTTPFSCPWDSGQVGFIFADDKARQEFDGDQERIEECLRAEVLELDQYMRGEVFCYAIANASGEVLDSCGGYFGLDYATESATEQAKALQ